MNKERWHDKVFTANWDKQIADAVPSRALQVNLLVAMLAGGHLLVEGVPGLAKTLTVKTLAQAVHGTSLTWPVAWQFAQGFANTMYPRVD